MKETFRTLKPATKRWVKKTQKDFVLESHHDRLLILAAAAWDRATEAKSIIDAEGAVILDRFKQQRPHPAISIERDSMLTFSKLLRELALDLEPPAESRPPRQYGS